MRPLVASQHGRFLLRILRAWLRNLRFALRFEPSLRAVAMRVISAAMIWGICPKMEHPLWHT